MAKLIVSRLDTDPDQPPALAEGSFDPEEDGVRTEGDLVRRVFKLAGAGVFQIVSNLESKLFKPILWKGEIMVEDRDSLVYRCDENRLESLASISVPEKPATGVLKRVDRPAVSRLQH